jgi:phenylalanyl-tRNA synthetase beta chain
MKVPESWLRSFVDPAWSSERLAEALTMAGLEVEESTQVAPPFNDVVVAEVKSVARHPNADKLTVCEVDTGRGLHTIVCGAPNVAPGVRVPCALPGAVLPGGLAIKATTMRGVQSDGMLCSARELALSDDHAGLLILAPDAPIGIDIREYLALDDTVFLLKLTPNRPDCLGIYGVAREVAAASGAPLAPLAFPPVKVTLGDRLAVTVSAPDLCGRFSGRVIRGVDARAATPAWMKSRLERAGQRSISALVDISNYVMLELGRPTHVFDLQKIHGGLDVRWGRDGETLKLLNGQTVELDPTVGVIADEREVESLAGIMGGDATAVSLDTTDIYVEAAFWWPAAIAGRSRRFNFATDAGHRFERGVDAATTVDHIEYLSRLILETCGGKAGPIDDTICRLPERKPVGMRVERARKVIGVDIPESDMAQAFERLGLPFVRTTDSFIVTPPSYRFDLEIEEDLIEEVARMWGFDRLPMRPPKAAAPVMGAPEAVRPLATLKRLIAASDYQEVINYSFVDSVFDARLSGATAIRVLNPMVAQMSVMRTSLFGGLLENLRLNLNRKATRVRLFEIGRVYVARPERKAGPLSVQGIDQPWRLGLLAFGPALDEQWGAATRIVDYFDVKGDLQRWFGSAELRFERADSPSLHPGRSARIVLGGADIGMLGSLHPALQQQLELPQAPMLAEIDAAALTTRPVPEFADVSNFPPVIRDLAFVVPDVVFAQQMLDEMWSAVHSTPAGRVVKDIKLFDEYRGKGLENKEKSLAFRFWMQDTERTLSDLLVDSALAVVIDRVEHAVGGRLRK